MAGANATGVVVSAGKMMKTVKVRVAQQVWNNHIRKFFAKPTHFLVRDPNSSTREGDIVRIAPGFRVSKQVRHVVTDILAPFGEPLDARAPVPSEAQRQQELDAKRAAKLTRRADRRRLSASTPNRLNSPQEEGSQGWNVSSTGDSATSKPPKGSLIVDALVQSQAAQTQEARVQQMEGEKR